MKTLKEHIKKIVITGLIFLSGIGVSLISWSLNTEKIVEQKLSGVGTTSPLAELPSFRVYDFFTASSTNLSDTSTTTSATSTNITPFFNSIGVRDEGQFIIAGAKDVTLYFSRATDSAGNTGTSTFSVQVSPDGTNWYDYNFLTQATTTLATANDAAFTRRFVEIGYSTTTQVMKMAKLGWYSLRCLVVEAIDGTHSCRATATF